MGVAPQLDVETIEAAAKAMYEHAWCDSMSRESVPVPWENIVEATRFRWLGSARAALSAALVQGGAQRAAAVTPEQERLIGQCRRWREHDSIRPTVIRDLLQVIDNFRGTRVGPYSEQGPNDG